MFYCLRCVVPKLNWKNHNVTPLRQHDSAPIQQSWEHRLRTLEYLFHDLIGFSEIKFSNRSEGKVAVSIPIVRKPRYNACLHYRLTNVFSSWEIIFWDYKRQEYTIQNTALPSQRLVVPLTAIEVQPVE